MKSRFYASIILLILDIPLLNAQDRLFNYVYQSTVLNKGQREIEVHNTFRFGHDDFYRAFDHRIEFETGLGSNLQTSFYLNVTNEAFPGNTVNWTNDPLAGPVSSINTEIVTKTSFSFSNEWKFKMSDPVANALGSALYGELKLSSSELEIEGRLILDKLSGKFYHSFNAVAEPEWEEIVENGVTKSKNELSFGFDYGLSRELSKNFNFGLEVRNSNKYDGSSEFPWEYSSFFAGPVLSYHTDKFWINLTILPQITGYRHMASRWEKQLILDDQEKLEARIIFSYAL